MKIIYIVMLVLFASLNTFAQKVWPHLQLKQGTAYAANIVSKSKAIQTINGHPLDLTTTISAHLVFAVSGITDTLYDMQVRYDSLDMQIELPGALLTYSSNTADTTIFSIILNRLKMKSFSLKLGKTGTVFAIDSIEKAITGIVDSLGDFSAQQKEQALTQMEQVLGTGQLKANIEAFTCIYPKAPVSRTEKWLVDNDIEGRTQVKQHAIYFIKDINPIIYIIGGTSTINSIDKAVAKLNGMPVKYRLAGLSTIIVTIDKKTGWVKQAEIVRRLKGNTEIQDNPKLPGGMLIPTETTVTISILPDK